MLREAFGFDSLEEVPAFEIGERSYPIGHQAVGGLVPVVVAPAGASLDATSPELGDGTRRRSAFGLAQEFLNAHDGSLWGIASDGIRLRIARDNASLTRPAWIEADLERIFTEERYADFTALWLLLHETRFGREGQPGSESLLEQWREQGRQEGTRAREHLRRGVEEALIALGQGFLTHRDNAELRQSLQTGELTTKEYFNQLLRLVYRMIFLITVEERGLLHPPDVGKSAASLYADGYSMRRLRERSVRRNAHDRFSDLWEGTKIAFRGLASGEPRLGLPALAGIFAANNCPALDEAKLENRWLLLAIFRLAWLREEGALARVNWRDMGPEELGSVYESLLELVPQITQDGRHFAFATGAETKGNARKTTGSYYTPDSLVQVLLDSALEPVVAETIARKPDNALEALLELSIVDPACGSGHFLLAAARRLAAHIARLQANGTPTAADYRHALRQVVGRCIYGVDLNPMAVELCKVSLWMEAVEPGLPLTFLDAHIQRGNALLGTTPELMADGIPDDAWQPIEGDELRIATALKKRNKSERSGQRSLQFGSSLRTKKEQEVLTQAAAALETASDASSDALAEKESRWGAILDSAEYRHQKFVADAWCAAFVWPKVTGDLDNAAPTHETWRQIRDGEGQLPSALTVTAVNDLDAQYTFFHWHLQFPLVFATGGFDVVLGNPPWDQLMFREQEFFAARAPLIAAAGSESKRKALIDELPNTEPALYRQYQMAVRASDAERAFVLRSRRFPRGARGRVNTYLLFCELAATVSPERAGLIVPTGVATDDSGRELFAYLFGTGRIARLWDFENRARLFPEVDTRARFCLLVLRPQESEPTDFCFGLHSVQESADEARHFKLTTTDLELINPNTKTCPSFSSERDAAIVRSFHARLPILLLEFESTLASRDSGWRVVTKPGLFNMATDSRHFLEEPETHGVSVVPVIEGKMITFFDHRFADVVLSETAMQRQGQSEEIADDEKLDPCRGPRPRYWVQSEEVGRRISGQWDRGWIAGWKEITSPTNTRTLIATAVPLAAIGHKIPVFLPAEQHRWLTFALCANLSAFVCDFVCRKKLNGTSLTPFTVKQLPVLPPSAYDDGAPWEMTSSVGDWIRPRALELSYSAWDLEPYASDLGYEGPPFRWEPGRRFLLRCELDAAFFHLYGVSRDDADYVMDTFPIVQKNDEKAHGEYRTKRVILEIYDAMAEAARSGQPYQTRLDPPPADPRVAHPESSRPEWAKKMSAAPSKNENEEAVS